MILILSNKYDVHADTIIKILNKRKLSYFRLNLDVDSLKKTNITYEDELWKIKSPKGILNSEDISCVWCRRPFVELTMEEAYDTSPDLKIWKNEWNQTLLGFYFCIKDIPWLNRLKESFNSENKYYQMAVAKEVGFNIPKTIVSNNKKILLDYYKRNKPVVMKLMSQEFYKLDSGKFNYIYVNKLNFDDLSQFKNNSENPIVLQEYLEKLYEVRYTIVGKNHFPCKIESQKSNISNVDWRRYDIPNTPHLNTIAPKDIEKKVNLFMHNLGIEYGAIDFIVTPDNEWYFLEINPSGQWLWIEELTDMKISDSIVDWLQKNM